MRSAEPAYTGARLRQARLASGLSAAELAEKVGVTRQAIYAAEAGKPLSAEKMQHAGLVLGVALDFFYRPIPQQAEAEGAINFRRLKSTPEAQKDWARSALGWMAELALLFEELLQLPATSLPDLGGKPPSALGTLDIEEAAIATRRHFGLGFGPIDKLLLLLENHGILVGTAPLSAEMDGVSAWFNGRAAILIKSDLTAFRARFDLAHELGHLVLHRHLHPDDLDDKATLDLVEDQAHHFAGAFLLPEASYGAEAVRTDLDYLLVLKRRWGVSIAAQIKRLQALEMLTKDQCARRWQGLARRRWRNPEPLDHDTRAETPLLLRRAAEFLAKHQALPFHEAFTRSRLPRRFLAAVAGLQDHELDPPPAALGTVIQFRRTSD